MRKYTKEELFEWMEEQPDDKNVRMNRGCIDGGFGCLLGEFAKSKGIKRGFSHVLGKCVSYMLFKRSITVDLGGKHIFDFFNRCGSSETFGQLKKELKEEYKQND